MIHGSVQNSCSSSAREHGRQIHVYSPPLTGERAREVMKLREKLSIRESMWNGETLSIHRRNGVDSFTLSAKKKKQLKLKKQPAVEIEESESNEGEMEPRIKEVEEEIISEVPKVPTTNSSS